jgi:BirA family biotin operon repressor/biotin-[acetyl-CoA-carboxylase] ligase
MQPSAWTVERVATTGSTMDDAKAKARAGAPDRWAVVAETMTGGRGTNGRPWHAPAGGLYTSFILRGAANPHLVTLALGNAVADVLEVAGVEPRIKWVNDVWVGERKVAGILVEAESTGARLDFLVCGIGMNLNGKASAFPSDLRGKATTLEEELGCDVCVPDLEVALWPAIDLWLDRAANDPARVVDRSRERDLLRGRRVVVTSGASRTEGTAAGLDGDGRLLVETAVGTKTVSAGTVGLV